MKKISLTSWIFIAMATGIVLGIAVPDFAKELAPVSSVFLRLIKSIIAPLVFATLVYGIAGTGSAKTMGRIGLKSILYFEVVTTIALFLGLAAVNLVKPGIGVNLPHETAQLAANKVTLSGMLEHTFPSSIIEAMSKGEVLQIVIFAFIFGTACTTIGTKAKSVVDWCKSLSDIMFEYTKFIMYFAPFGVGAAMAVTIGSKGIGVLFNLGQLIATLFASLLIFVVVVLGAVMVIFKIPMRRFIQAVKDPYILAFSTASSEAALPQAMENMERFGVPKHIVSFVLPTGYSFNLDGSTLYLSLASVFIAQAAGVEMSFGTQLMMMLTLMLTSKGVAAVPRASMVVLSGTLATFDLPLEGVALVMGVDTIMDMARTSVNLLGNCLATAAVAKWEGVELPTGDLEPIEAAIEAPV
ncbi:dicarboxylate/amino acid:cation symporter [Bryobacter aggregatus]|uniref:dicarboxylate/amino acid:cation symporter n=1 Tax=Bryobacter aggregatus TaxID=360054 RepID=UPI00068B7E9D|nr:cation:dicarboxylase symporter family transporter [Bryobacter aggregatus]